MVRVTFVKKARKADKDAGIKKGDSYYWWKFRHGGIHKSLTPPKRSQLTQSSFYATIWDIEDDVIGKATADDGLEGVRDDVVSQLENAKSECEDSLQNLPEQFQEGHMLNERIESLETAISEFENLEFEFDLESAVEDDDEINDIVKAKKMSVEDRISKLITRCEEIETEHWEAKLSELQEVTIET